MNKLIFVTDTTLKHTKAFLEKNIFEMENHYFYAKDISTDVFYFYCYIWQNNSGQQNEKFWQMVDALCIKSNNIDEIFNSYCIFIRDTEYLLQKYPIKINPVVNLY